MLSATLPNEEKALLSTEHSEDSADSEDSEDSEIKRGSSFEFEISESMVQESFILIKLAFPICLNHILEIVPDTISLIYIGNLSNADTSLSSLGLSRTLFVLIVAILYGVYAALDTLIPQAIGASKKDLIALYVQRSFYLTFISSLPFIFVFYYGGTIFSYIISTTDINYDMVNMQCRYFIFTTWIYIYMIIILIVPVSMNLNFQLLIVNLISTSLSYPFCYLFITDLNMNSYGLPLVIAACYIINILLIIVLYYKYDLLYVFKPVSLYKIFNLKGIKDYTYLAMPSVIISIFETIIFDFVIIYCSWITSANIAISASVVIISILSFIKYIGYALWYAFAIRIGKYVGANMINKAKQCIKCCKILEFIISTIIFIILISARTQIPKLYTYNKEIADLSSDLIYVIMISQFFFLGVLARYGIFSGIGKPIYPAIIAICSYILFPFPNMFVLLFAFNLKNSLLYGTLSIFISIGIGNLIACIIMETHLLYFVNWKSITDDTDNRLSEMTLHAKK